jgi:lipopolysaccharide export LptBFGC system permease protein LptF
MLSMLKDPEDMTLIGPVIKEQQKIINDTIEKKLSLSKLQSTIWEKSNKSNDDDFSLTDFDDEMLQNLIQKDINKPNSGTFNI